MTSKAIVTPFPGTTRDPVETFVQIKGIPVHITDTAGLHSSLDPIEQIGMDKTRESLTGSDLILLVMQIYTVN